MRETHHGNGHVTYDFPSGFIIRENKTHIEIQKYIEGVIIKIWRYEIVY